MKSSVLPYIITLLLISGCASKNPSVHTRHEEATSCIYECSEIVDDQAVEIAYEELELPDYKELIEES